MSFATCVLLLVLSVFSGTFIDFMYYLLVNTCLTIGIFISLVMINSEKLFSKNKVNKSVRVNNVSKITRQATNQPEKIVKRKIS